jgi:DNA-binding NarL/FixJ family response regulator
MSYKILIVDDSKLARMAMAKALNALYPDWTRLEATNAEEAIAMAQQSDADIAVLDFNMPGRDGLALAGELRDWKPTMPAAVISANIQDEIVQRTRAVGATFLPKPLTEQALSEFLTAAVQRLKAGTQ